MEIVLTSGYASTHKHKLMVVAGGTALFFFLDTNNQPIGQIITLKRVRPI